MKNSRAIFVLLTPYQSSDLPKNSKVAGQLFKFENKAGLVRVGYPSVPPPQRMVQWQLNVSYVPLTVLLALTMVSSSLTIILDWIVCLLQGGSNLVTIPVVSPVFKKPLSSFRISTIKKTFFWSFHGGATGLVASGEHWDMGCIPAWAQCVVKDPECCHSCSLGCDCGWDLIPGLGVPYAMGRPKKPNQTKTNKQKNPHSFLI